MNAPLRDHGFYWVKHPDYPEHQIVAKWCHLQASGCHVWLLPGDEDYRYDDGVTVISTRLPEPRSSSIEKVRDWLGLRNAKRNVAFH